MKTTLLIRRAMLLAAVCLTYASSALAQHDHGDIELAYEDGMVEIHFGEEGHIFESEFPTTGPYETDEPGFVSEEEAVIPEGDIIDYLVLGPLKYHNGSSFAPVPSGAAIAIEGLPSATFTVDANTSGPINGPGIIDMADADDEIHSHLEFTLTPPTLSMPAYGAYGILMQVTTDATGIADSDPFYLVFNFGLEEEIFEGAVGAFAAQVPEPSSLVVLGISIATLGFLRRR